VKAKARLVAIFSRSGSAGARFALALPTAALLVLFLATGARAAYTPGSPLTGVGNVSSVAVNQTSHDLYASSQGGFPTTPGTLTRFDSSGTNLGCTLGTSVWAGGISVNPTNENLTLLDYGSTNSGTGTVRAFGATCGSEVGSPFTIAGASASKALSQQAVDASGNIYYPNSSFGELNVFSSTGVAIPLAHPIEGYPNVSAAARDSSGNLYVAQASTNTSNEKQKVVFTTFVAGNQFTLGNLPGSPCTSSTTGAISYATGSTLKANIKTALEAVCGANFGTTENAPNTLVTFQGVFVATNVPQMTCTKETGSGSCAVTTLTGAGPASTGELHKFKADGTPEGTFAKPEVTSVAINKATGDFFVGKGHGTTFHIEKRSATGVKLADFGSGIFGNISSNTPMNQLAVDETSGKVYATDPESGKVQVFSFAASPKLGLTVEKAGTGSGTVTSDRGEPTAINCGVACPSQTQSFEETSYVTLTASENSGSEFVQWENCDEPGPLESGTSGALTAKQCRVSINAAKTVKAKFAATGKALKVIRDGAGTGTVTSAQSGVGAEPINCGSHCEEFFTEGALVTLTASAGTHSTFSGWSVTGEPGACPGTGTCEVTMSADKEVHATFGQITHSFSLNTAGGTGTGTVQCNGLACASSYPEGTALTLTETPGAHSAFSGWSITGDPGTTCTGTTSPCTVTVEADITANASFDLISRSFSLNTDGGTGTGAVKCNGVACASSYPESTVLTLTATPDTHNSFAGWSITGDPGTTCTGTTSPCTLTVEANITANAAFNQIVHNLTITTTSGSGSGSVQCNPGTGSEACKAAYPEGTEVTISQSAAFGSEFKGWSGCDSEPAGNCKVTLGTDKSVSATFDLEPGQKKLDVKPSGEGEVKCKVGLGSFGTCSPTYTEGTSLTLEATAGPHATFSGWSGGTGSASACTGTGTCAFTINADSSVNAPFPLTQRSLTIAKAGTGNGSFECKTTGAFGACSSSYADGETITVKATPDSHSTFVSWAGCSSTTANECTVSAIAANTTVTATFNLAQRTLTINKAGTGNGSFECDSGSGFGSCASSYADGETITVKATPDAHSTFAGWSGGGCSGVGNCVIASINANTTVTGTFTLTQRTLTIAKAGTGNGSFECKTTGAFGACAASYADGETITVKATPDSHSTFVSWASCSSTTANECTVSSIASNTTVTATFNLAQRTLTVNKAGTGDGSFSCDTGSGPSACAASYPDGTDITISATPLAGSSFAGWSGGGCSGTGNCVINDIAANTTVTGTFNLNQSTLTINKTGSGNGSFTCDTGSGPGACLSAYPNGATVTIAATPNSHSTFGGWSGSGCSGTGTCVITLSSNKTVSAAFSLAQRILTLEKKGSGDGSFLCDTGSGYLACQASYADGTTLVVKATPDANSTFGGWEGCAHELGPGKCAIEGIGANTTLSATFTAIPPPPTPESGGSSSGSSGPPAASSPPAASAPPATPKPLKCKKGSKKRMVRGKPHCVKVKPHKRHRRQNHRRVTLVELIREVF
jgi:List-Bact-rpt repeat protein